MTRLAEWAKENRIRLGAIPTIWTTWLILSAINPPLGAALLTPTIIVTSVDIAWIAGNYEIKHPLENTSGVFGYDTRQINNDSTPENIATSENGVAINPSTVIQNSRKRLFRRKKEVKI